MRNLIWTALAAGFVLASVGIASAQDTIRLGGPAAQSAIQGGTDTELVRGRYYGHYGHGHYHRGHYGHYGYHNHYRPSYGYGYYGRSHYGNGYGNGYYGNSYYYPRVYSNYSPSFYYPSYYSYYEYNRPAYYPSSFYIRIGGDTVPSTTTLQQYQAPAPQFYVPPMPPADKGDGTFPYDGGPTKPLPMPNLKEAPRGIIPIDGRLVSLPTGISGGVRQVGAPVAQTTTTASQPRVTYPAYGEEPITPAPRKTK